MLTPSDLGLPQKFTDWRPGQWDVALDILKSKDYAFLLDSPTGTGKSLIAAAVQKLTSKNAVYLCTTKQLQDQLLNDFPYAKTLKGRSNYPCLLFPGKFPSVTAEYCIHSKKRQCKHIDRCPYKLAKAEALRAPLAVLNTAYFLSEANYVGGFSDTKLLVVDEFDTVEDQLMGFISVVIFKNQLVRLSIPEPRFKTKFESWIEWANPAIRLVSKELEKLHVELDSTDSWGTVEFSQLRREAELTKLLAKLSFFVREVNKDWVWYPGDDRWEFKPVWVAKYSSIALWDHAVKVLGMSATILDAGQVNRNIGVTMKPGRTFKYKELSSPFPKEHRPVVYEPCANLTNKTMDTELPKLGKAVQSLMNKHPNDKILIHTVSYKVRTFLMNNLDGGRIISHSAADRQQVLEKFKSSKRPMVLLSPSMDRGVDLPGDECRVVIIAKMPFPDLGDDQIRKRVYASKDGNSWYAHKTISKIIQMAGRGVRSVDDHAITYILDEQFERLLSKNRSTFPGWFLEALIT